MTEINGNSSVINKNENCSITKIKFQIGTRQDLNYCVKRIGDDKESVTDIVRVDQKRKKVD